MCYSYPWAKPTAVGKAKWQDDHCIICAVDSYSKDVHTKNAMTHYNTH